MYNDNEYNNDEFSPGIFIRAAIVSPITNEIYFVCEDNRLVRPNDFEIAAMSMEFILPEYMSTIFILCRGSVNFNFNISWLS